MVHQQRNILAPLPQGRNLDRENVEPVEKILTKLVLPNHGSEIAMRRGNQPHVYLDRLRASETLELLLLDCPQQFRLEFQADIPDLIQKERAPVRQFKSAFSLDQSSSERPLLMTEQFAFEQSRGNGGAVHPHIRLLTSRAEVMDGARNQFLSSAGLSVEQDRGIGGGNDGNLLQHPLNG